MLSIFYFLIFCFSKLGFLDTIAKSLIIFITYLLTSFAVVEASIYYISLIILFLYSSMLTIVALKLS